MVFSKLIIHTDGGARGNPGPAAIGVVIKNGEGKIVAEVSETIGEATNNIAEYQAVVHALHHLRTKNIQASAISFFLDSRLVVEQLSGRFKIKAGHLKELLFKIKILEQEVGGKILYQHIPREQNSRADELVNRALDSIETNE